MSCDIEKLIKSLSIKDKARQLTQINGDFIKKDVKGAATGISNIRLTSEDVFECGSVLNFGGADDSIHIREKYLENSKNKIPLVMMQDVIHGYRTIFPIPLALGCTFDMSVVEECCKMSGIEASLNGVDVTFSPMINLVRDARWGRVMETYSEDPMLNGLMGRSSIRGYRSGGVASCIKHYAAYGAAESGREYNATDMSEHTLREYYLPAFFECLKENPEVIMTSFNSLNGIPVNADKHLLVDILREEWGYDGVVVTDYGAAVEMINHGYAKDERECAKICINNGIDLEMMTSSYVNYLPELVEKGEVKMEQIDNCVRRVLKLKDKLNLFKKPLNATNAKKADEVCLSKEHRDIARRAAEKSFVLLENNGVLPLKKTDDVAFAGPFADEKSIIGAWACAGKFEESVTVVESAEIFLGHSVPHAKGCQTWINSTDESLIENALSVCENAKTAVVCIGEHSWCSGESASRTNIDIPSPQMKLVRLLKERGKKTVAVVFGGRPQILTKLKEFADAILYVWQPGTEGGNAIINTLYGVNVPQGKLTISFPRSVGQCPIYYNCFNTGRPKKVDVFENSKYSSSYIDEYNSPLYPFGYGLSYTKFEYSNGRISNDKMKRGETLTAKIKVKNVGKISGYEVVQLYICDKFASCIRPIRELKDFKKIYLNAGEEKEVSFTITEETLKFFTAKGEYAAEIGLFDIMLGSDCTCKIVGTFELVE